MTSGRQHASEMWQALVQALDERRDQFSDSSEEARRRAALALEVLTGRQAPRPWLPLAAAAAFGILVGWAAAEAYRTRRPQIEQALSAAGEQVHQTKAAVEERIGKAKAAPGGPVEKAKAAFADDGDDATGEPSKP